ncbi:hypothetical protein [Cellulomonas sp. NS3]|uniref:hypothetical protein n=1 Tax=Cellulomonas sp. NS3 TaxID=2973977 RepID=UPI002161DB46|nr:hypothetical protein [Cellulomonas sp. NS3]
MRGATAVPGCARRRAVPALVAAVLAAVLVAGSAGCGPGRVEPRAGSPTSLPGTPAPDGPEPAASGPDADPSGNLRLLAEHGPPPLDAWGWSSAEAGTVARAVEELTARCMAEHGFTVERDAGGGDDAAGDGGTGGDGDAGGADGVLGEPVTHWGGFLGLVGLDRARATGYQVLDVDARLAERARLEREAARTPDPAYVAALTGEGAPDADAPDGGCSGWAFGRVTPADPAVDRRIQERLYGEALQRAEGNPAVVRALDGWVACMARRGYDLDAVPVPASTDPVTPELVEQAVADVGCKDETDLVDTYVTVLYRAERALAAEHRAVLDAFAAWGRERVRLAAEALAG